MTAIKKWQQLFTATSQWQIPPLSPLGERGADGRWQTAAGSVAVVLLLGLAGCGGPADRFQVEKVGQVDCIVVRGRLGSRVHAIDCDWRNARP